MKWSLVGGICAAKLLVFVAVAIIWRVTDKRGPKSLGSVGLAGIFVTQVLNCVDFFPLMLARELKRSSPLS